jgi:hypothetical protein
MSHLKMYYTYVRLAKDYTTNTIKEVPGTTTSYESAYITYAYENGNWVIYGLSV